MVLSDKENIDVFPVQEWNHFAEIVDALNAGLESPTTGKPYNWVAIDTISAASELAKRQALRDRGIADGPEQISQNDYGKIGSLMSNLFYQFQKLPLHVVFNSQEKLRETGDTHEYQPMLTPMALEALHPPQFLIGRLFVAEVADKNGVVTEERRLRVHSSERYMTKVRAIPGRQLDPILVNPNLHQILAWLLGVADAQQPVGIAGTIAANPFAPTGE